MPAAPAIRSSKLLTSKLVRRPLDRSELYDLRDDPGESRNQYGQPAYAAIQRELERCLLDWYIHTADVTPFDEDPRGHTFHRPGEKTL